MAPFKAFTEDAEVSGDAILAVLTGMETFTTLARKILSQCGIEDPQAGRWYRQQDWLDAFKLIAERVGPTTLRTIGRRIPETAQWPPGVDSVEKALQSLDVAYHMNHRIGGKVLYDPVTGDMRGDIGHYSYEHTGERSATVVCESPYPCIFDQGVVEALVKRFKPADSLLVTVEHDDTAPCKRNGADSCSYHVSW